MIKKRHWLGPFRCWGFHAWEEAEICWPVRRCRRCRLKQFLFASGVEHPIDPPSWRIAPTSFVEEIEEHFAGRDDAA